jgi:hypothetical protein
MVMLNPILYSWTIRDLVKNAIDAMKEGNLQITIVLMPKLLKSTLLIPEAASLKTV